MRNFSLILKSFCVAKDSANRSFSETGRMSGATVVMLVLNVLEATPTRSVERLTPVFPLSSYSW